MGRRIVLDAESFRALSSETRVQLLKHLDENRLTLTNLAKKMELAKATVSSHLESLENAGLIKRIDEGRKWIYYSLTRKGRVVLHPESEKVGVILALSVGLSLIGLASLLMWVVGEAQRDWTSAGLDSDGGPAISLLLGVGALLAGFISYVILIITVKRTQRAIVIH
ncbi:MAG: winged helix-turn-helix transcriptional regulator [Thermoplasmata archaeon]|nr:winged helix-turn-helix transcriptional regulator [Thermoplasmata archaeon]